MHKIFYASGFLYHPSSQQILLQQPTSMTSPWVLFEKEHTKSEQPENIFKEALLNKLLDIKIDTVYPIYAYLSETTQDNRSLFYATTKNLQDFSPKTEYTFRWFSFRDILKSQMPEQTKHDIVVGQRVIEAAERKDRGEYTF